MKYYILLLSIFSLSLISCQKETEELSAHTSLFNDNWYFQLDSTVPGETVNLPHTPRLEPMVVNDQWQGICFYRKEFILPDKSKSNNLFIRFDGAMNVADVWVNGQYMGKHLGGFLPFTIDISDVVHFDRENVIEVRLDNRDNPVTGPKPLHLLDFNTYGGLYRNVWLIEKPEVYITDPIHADKTAGGGIYVKTENVSETHATVTIQTHLENSSNDNKNIRITHILKDPKGNIVAQKEIKATIDSRNDNTLSASLNIKNPSLWSPETPTLYKLITRVYGKEQFYDEEILRIGFRDIKIDEKGVLFNGKKRFLRGVNRHQEYPYIGYALSDEAQYRDAWKIKAGGFDYVRASHYPPSPAFLDACDELGILILDAIPGWQYFGDTVFQEYAFQCSRDMIRRDRNHPCILAWEVSINETHMPETFMEGAKKIAREETPHMYTAGWMNTASYDIYLEARQHRHKPDLTKPLIVSEYGDWEYYAQNAGFNQNEWSNLLEEERTSRQPRESGEVQLLQQATNIQEAHNDNLSTHAFADGYWVMFDYNRGYADDLEHSGVMDIFRLPKYSYYFFRSQRSIVPDTPFYEPMLFIASDWIPGKSKGVRIFTNCDRVELFVDGQEITPDPETLAYISGNLPHPPVTFPVNCTTKSELHAIGYYQGEKVCESKIHSPEEPAAIHLEVDYSGKEATSGVNDILFVYAHLIDKNGTTLPENNTPLQFSLEGDGEIVGPDNLPAAAGIATILLRPGKHTNQLKITATDGNYTSSVMVPIKERENK